MSYYDEADYALATLKDEEIEPLSSDAVRSLIKEAKTIREHHPSKDARFFADKVYRFLSEHFI